MARDAELNNRESTSGVEIVDRADESLLGPEGKIQPQSINQTSVSLDKESEVVLELPVPPDGGWGWVVLCVAFYSNAMVNGLMASFGALLPHLADYYGTSTSETALVGSIMMGSNLMAGPLVSAFVNYYGGRLSAVFGAGLAVTALLVSTLSPSINVLIFTYGLLAGLGMCFVYIPATVMVGYYFERRRALAMGIASSGAGIGMLALAPMTAYFLDHFDWKYTVVMLAGVLIQVLVLAGLYRPLRSTRVNRKSLEKSRKSVVDDSGNRFGKGTELMRVTGAVETSNVSENDTDLENIAYKERNQMQKPWLKNVLGNKHISQQLLSLPEKSKRFDEYRETLRQNESSARSMSCDLGVLYFPRPLSWVDTRNQPQNINSNHLGNTAGLSNRLDITSNGEKTDIHTTAWHSCRDLQKTYPKKVRPVRSHGKLDQGSWSPVLRRDVFYSGSVHTLPEYRAQPDQASYLASMLEPAEGDPPRRAACPGGGFCGILARMLDPAVCIHPAFVILGLGAFFIQLGFLIPIVYMTKYCATIDIDAGQAALLISIMGVGNTIGRAGAGALANLPCVNTLYLCNISLLLTGGSTMTVSLCRSFIPLAVYSATFGLCVAVSVPLTSLLLVQYIGLNKLTNSYGYLSLVRGVASMVGPPLAGALLDLTSSYAVVFLFSGSMFILAVLVQLGLACGKTCQHKPELISALA